MLLLPLVLSVSAIEPKAELLVPVVLLSKAANPSNVFVPTKGNGVTANGVSACALGKSAKEATPAE